MGVGLVNYQCLTPSCGCGDRVRPRGVTAKTVCLKYPLVRSKLGSIITCNHTTTSQPSRQGGYIPQPSRQGGYVPQTSRQGGYIPQTSRQGGYIPQPSRQGGYIPTKPSGRVHPNQAVREGTSQPSRQGGYIPTKPSGRVHPKPSLQGGLPPPHPYPAPPPLHPLPPPNYRSWCEDRPDSSPPPSPRHHQAIRTGVRTDHTSPRQHRRAQDRSPSC